MKSRTACWVSPLPLIVTLGACSSKPAPCARPPVAPAPVAIVINAPTLGRPLEGDTTSGWPTFPVNNATHTGPAGALVYRSDISASADFGVVTLSGTVSETPTQTSFTPPSSQPPPVPGALFWRAIAIDQANSVLSPASAAQSFKYASTMTVAINIGLQQGVALWPGVQPAGQ